MNVYSLRGSTIRVGRTAEYGPTYVLARYDRSHKTYCARNVHNGIEEIVHTRTLLTWWREGLIHVLSAREAS